MKQNKFQFLILGLGVIFLSVFWLVPSEDHPPRRISPFDVLKVQVLLERSGRVKAEYEKIQMEIQAEISRETSRMYLESGLKSEEYDIDLQKGEFTAKIKPVEPKAGTAQARQEEKK